MVVLEMFEANSDRPMGSQPRRRPARNRSSALWVRRAMRKPMKNTSRK